MDSLVISHRWTGIVSEHADHNRRQVSTELPTSHTGPRRQVLFQSSPRISRPTKRKSIYLRSFFFVLRTGNVSSPSTTVREPSTSTCRQTANKMESKSNMSGVCHGLVQLTPIGAGYIVSGNVTSRFAYTLFFVASRRRARVVLCNGGRVVAPMDLGSHPVLTVMAIAVAASLLAEVRLGVLRVPVVVWEMLFAIAIGPPVESLKEFVGGHIHLNNA